MPSNPEKILIVDNDPHITDQIGRQTLTPMGYHVQVTDDAVKALDLVLKHTPDLILSNLNLPGLSGKDLLVALASQGIKSPLIVIAEQGQEADAIEAFRLGATDVLFWPARDAEVVSAVERALSLSRESRARQKLTIQLKAANEELEQRLKELTSLLNLGKAVVSLTDQRELFTRILEGALEVSEADIAWLLLREENSETFLLRAQMNLPQGWAKHLDETLEDGLSPLVAGSGESLIIHGDPLRRFKIAALGRSAGVIPIKVQNKVMGLLLVVRKSDREFDREVQALLEGMADYASISLVNARLFRALDQAAQSARSEERRRYATLQSIRESIRAQVMVISNPLNLVLSEMPGEINAEQKRALEAVQKALNQLTRISEKTMPATEVLGEKTTLKT
jgi:DNA-binding response OmpR family regulator